MKRFLALTLSSIAALGASVALASWTYSNRPSAVVADALGIGAAPPSVREVLCKSWGVTDVLTTCAFRVEAQDVPRLLTGLRWTVVPASGGSYAYGSGPQVGAEFPVAAEYQARPLNAPNGGLVRLVMDASRTRAQVNLYVE